MKKLISIFLVALLVLSTLPLSLADGQTAIAKTDETAIKSGKSSINYSSNPTKANGIVYGYDVWVPNTWSGQWFNFDVTNPQHNYLGELQSGRKMNGEYYNGTLYTITNTWANEGYYLGTVDTQTYAYTQVALTKMLLDIDFDYKTMQMFGLYSNKLGVLDLTTGHFDEYCEIVGMHYYPAAMCITTEGQVYVVEYVTGDIYSVDKYTGVALLVGSTGIAISNSIQSMTYDHDADICYLGSYNDESFSVIYNLDLSTAQVSEVYNIGTAGRETSCLHTRPESIVVPDPVNVSGVGIAPKSLQLVEGKTGQLTSMLLPQNEYILDRSITYSSDDETIATVNEIGLVTAVSEGTATITVTTTDGGFTDTATVTVLSRESANVILSDAINAEGSDIAFDTSLDYRFNVATTDSRVYGESSNQLVDYSKSAVFAHVGVIGGSTLNFDWMTSSEIYDTFTFMVDGIAIESISGITEWTTYQYTFEKTGIHELRWEYFKDYGNYNGFDSARLDEVWIDMAQGVPATGVTLEPASKTITIGSELRMHAFIEPANAQNPNLTWESSDETVATINEYGVVTAISAGTTQITVTTEDGGFSATSDIRVVEVPVAISHRDLDYSQEILPDNSYPVTLGLGESPLIVKPSSTGDPGWSNTWAKGFSINMEEGSGVELTTSVNTEYKDTTMWIFDENFQCVAYCNDYTNEQGEYVFTSYLKFIPLTSGTYYVLVSMYSDIDEISDVYLEVESYDPVRVTGVSISPNVMEVKIGRLGQLNAVIEPANADIQGATWTSSNPEFAYVDDTGKVTAVAEGETVITATTIDGGFSATATIIVGDYPNPEYDGLLYGYNMYDNSGNVPQGFVSIDPAAPQNVTSINANSLNLYSGEYYDGLYYAYSQSGTTIYYYCIDPMTWTIQSSVNWLYDVCYDMAYDYSTNTMYGLTEAMNIRQLVVVDIYNGYVTTVASLATLYGDTIVTLACDNDGQLYGAASSGMIYKIDKETGECSDYISTGIPVNYIQSMTYDHVGRYLYWAQCSDTESNLLKISTVTNEVVDEHPLGSGIIEISGLFTITNPDDITDPPIPGDANRDGVLNTGDAACVLRYLVNLIDESEIDLIVADINGDGNTNTGDASMILEICLN